MKSNISERGTHASIHSTLQWRSPFWWEAHRCIDNTRDIFRPFASFIPVTWDKFSDTGLCVCHISEIKHSWVLVQRKIGKALEWKDMRLTKCPMCTINLKASFHVLQLGIEQKGIDLWVIAAATTQCIHKTYIKRPGWGERWRQKEQAKSLGRWLIIVRAAW